MSTITSNSEPPEFAVGIGAELFREGTEEPRSSFHEKYAGGGGIDAAEIADQRHLGQFRNRPGQLDAGLVGPDNDEGHQGATLGLVVAHLGFLEGQQQAPADCHASFRVFSAGATRAHSS